MSNSGGIPASGFCHLHVRSGFSWGLGAATPEELVGLGSGLGMGALALTDRDTLAGMPRFLRACDEHGLSPIVGAEITVEASRANGPGYGPWHGPRHRGHVV